MDRLRLIEVIRAEFDAMYPWMEPAERGRSAGRIADAIIRARAVRIDGDDRPGSGGATMPPGPWSGSA